MGRESKIAAVKFATNPDRKQARQMLREIATRRVPFTPREVDKPLILYGAGDLGKMAKEYFDLLGIPFLFVVDASPDGPRKDPFWAGIEIRGKAEVSAEQRATALLAICVATVPFTVISQPLFEQGWQDVVPFYDIAEAYLNRHPLSNGWHAGELNDLDLFGIDSVLYRWEDDVSRAHHMQFVAWRCLREEWFFDLAPVNTRDRYFIPQVLSILHDHEVLVDVGAHHGEAILKFIDIVKHKYKEILAIEPDEKNFSRLQKNLRDNPTADQSKLRLLTCALGSTSGERRFYGGLGYVSQFSAAGQTEISVERLDDLSVAASFVKFHVEGWESSVFDGGLETIRKYRPILTVTSYHNREGLWYLPSQIMSCLEDYVYYFRLHSWQDGCSVIYAFPRERK